MRINYREVFRIGLLLLFILLIYKPIPVVQWITPTYLLNSNNPHSVVFIAIVLTYCLFMILVQIDWYDEDEGDAP